MTELWNYENRCWEAGYETVCGVDEAGRGPLAGPVCAAAVILPRGLDIPGLNDSKKLTAKRREALYDIITEQALAYGIAFASEQEIDEINILQATFLAMRRAMDQLRVRPDIALIDGQPRDGLRPSRADDRQGRQPERQYRGCVHSGQGDAGPLYAGNG